MGDGLIAGAVGCDGETAAGGIGSSGGLIDGGADEDEGGVKPIECRVRAAASSCGGGLDPGGIERLVYMIITKEDVSVGMLLEDGS